MSPPRITWMCESFRPGMTVRPPDVDHVRRRAAQRGDRALVADRGEATAANRERRRERTALVLRRDPTVDEDHIREVARTLASPYSAISRPHFLRSSSRQIRRGASRATTVRSAVRTRIPPAARRFRSARARESGSAPRTAMREGRRDDHDEHVDDRPGHQRGLPARRRGGAGELEPGLEARVGVEAIGDDQRLDRREQASARLGSVPRLEARSAIELVDETMRIARA